MALAHTNCVRVGDVNLSRFKAMSKSLLTPGQTTPPNACVYVWVCVCDNLAFAAYAQVYCCISGVCQCVVVVVHVCIQYQPQANTMFISIMLVGRSGVAAGGGISAQCNCAQILSVGVSVCANPLCVITFIPIDRPTSSSVVAHRTVVRLTQQQQQGAHV